MEFGREALVSWSQLEIDDANGFMGTEKKGEPCFQR